MFRINIWMKHKVLIAILLLLALLQPSHSTRYIYADFCQINYSPITSGTLQDHNFALSPIHQTDTKYQIVLSGYKYYAYQHHNLGMWILSWSSGQVIVRVTSAHGTRIEKLQFYIVAINTNNYVWLTSQPCVPQQLNQTSGLTSQLFQTSAQRPIANINDMEIVPLVKGWDYLGNSFYRISQTISYHSQVDQLIINIQIDKIPNSQLIHIGLTIVWINYTALSTTNYPRYRNNYDFYWIDSSNYHFVKQIDPMLEIPELYYPKNTTLSPRCFLGFDYVALSGSTWSGGGNTVTFNTQNNPIDEIFLQGAYYTMHYLGFGINPQPYESRYQAFCFDQQCPTFSYFNGTSQLCLPCSYACSDCLNNYCIKCQLGTLINGKCSLIPGCIDFIHHDDNSQTCLACNESQQFKLNNYEGICQCVEGTTLFDMQCVPTIQGCIVYDSLSDGSHPCLFCNVTGKYTGVANSDGQCSCRSGFQSINSTCTEVCGDGVMISLQSSACDDGNIINGDGCSSSCTVQKFYICHNGSDTSPSACVYIGLQLNVTLNSIQKIEGANSGQFSFMINPSLLNLDKMNFTKYLKLECDTNYDITSITYSQGEILISVDYTEDMEDRQCTLTLDYDPTIVNRSTSKLTFDVKSQTAPLIISNKLMQYQQIQFIFGIISIIALGLFFLGLPRKMLGVEILSCCQMTLLSLCLFKRPIHLYTALKGLDPVSGGWPLFTQSNDSSQLLGLTDRINISSIFLENSGIITGSLTAVVILWGFFMLVKNCQEQPKKPENQNSFNRNADKTHCPTLPIFYRAVIILYNWLIFSITAGFFLVLTLSMFINNYRFGTFQKSEGLEILSSLAMLFVCALIGSVFGIEIFEVIPYGGARSEPVASRWYIPLFLIKNIFSWWLLVFEFSRVYPLMSIEMLLLLYLIFKRPYRSGLMNLGVIFCQVVVIYAFGLPILHRFYSPTEDIDVLLLFVLQGMMLLAEFMTFVRIIKSFYNSAKLLCAKKDEQNNSGEPKIRKKQQSNKRINNANKQQTIDDSPYAPYLTGFRGESLLTRQKKWQANKIQAQEEQTLNRIKDKLRTDFYEKKERQQQLMEEVP